jgi:glutaredoxin
VKILDVDRNKGDIKVPNIFLKGMKITEEENIEI